jgi:hypothetical protein
LKFFCAKVFWMDPKSLINLVMHNLSQKVEQAGVG